MTLVSIDDHRREIHLQNPLKAKYEWLVLQLGSELGAIQKQLNEMIDVGNETGEEVHTAGWMPGKNWQGTPFQPIYQVCGQDVEEAGRCFGLLVWKVFEARPEIWASTHGMKDGKEIRSRTYFRP